MVTIKLLGRPAILGDGIAFEGPRGKKSWGLLTTWSAAVRRFLASG